MATDRSSDPVFKHSYGGPGGQAFANMGRASKSSGSSSSSSSSKSSGSGHYKPSTPAAPSVGSGGSTWNTPAGGKSAKPAAPSVGSGGSTWNTPAGGKSAKPKQETYIGDVGGVSSNIPYKSSGVVTPPKNTNINTGGSKGSSSGSGKYRPNIPTPSKAPSKANLSKTITPDWTPLLKPTGGGSSNPVNKPSKTTTVTQTWGDERGDANTYRVTINDGNSVREKTIMLGGGTPSQVMKSYHRIGDYSLDEYLIGIKKYQQSLTPYEKSILEQTQSGGLYLNSGSTKGYHDKTGLVNPETLSSKTFTENTVNNAAASKALVGASGATPTILIGINDTSKTLLDFTQGVQASTEGTGFRNGLSYIFGEKNFNKYLSDTEKWEAAGEKSANKVINSVKSWVGQGDNTIPQPTTDDVMGALGYWLNPTSGVNNLMRKQAAGDKITGLDYAFAALDVASFIPGVGILTKGGSVAGKAGATIAKNVAKNAAEDAGKIATRTADSLSVKRGRFTAEDPFAIRESKLKGNLAEDATKASEKTIAKNTAKEAAEDIGEASLKSQKSKWQKSLGKGVKAVGAVAGANLGVGILGSLIANDGSDDFSGQQTDPSNNNQRGDNTFEGDTPNTATDALLLPYQPNDGGDFSTWSGGDAGAGSGGGVTGGSDQSGGEHDYNNKSDDGDGGKYEIYNQAAPDYSALANALKIIGVLALVGIIIMAFSQPTKKGVKT